MFALLTRPLSVGRFSYLQIVERVHFHDGADGVDGQRDVDALAGHQWSVDGQRTGGNHPKATQRRQTNKSVILFRIN